VQVLGVSFDTVEDNRAFAEKYKFNFPLLCDTKREIGVAYGACDDAKAKTAKRISYLIGKDGAIRKAYPKVNAAEHANDVMSDL
jgi:peroxiredoxin Q/BCP